MIRSASATCPRYPLTTKPSRPKFAMYSGGPEDRPSPKELEERIRDYLFATLRTLTSLNLDISLYLWHHDNQNPRRDPFGGNGLDDAYTLYEERANDCRRLWMKLRAASEKRTSLTKAAGNSSPPRSRLDLERSSSPLEYQSAIEENEPAETRRNNQVTPMDVDPVEMERDIPWPSTPVIDLPPPKSKLKVRLCSLQSCVSAGAIIQSRTVTLLLCEV